MGISKECISLFSLMDYFNQNTVDALHPWVYICHVTPSLFYPPRLDVDVLRWPLPILFCPTINTMKFHVVRFTAVIVTKLVNTVKLVLIFCYIHIKSPIVFYTKQSPSPLTMLGILHLYCDYHISNIEWGRVGQKTVETSVATILLWFQKILLTVIVGVDSRECHNKVLRRTLQFLPVCWLSCIS